MTSKELLIKFGQLARNAFGLIRSTSGETIIQPTTRIMTSLPVKSNGTPIRPSLQTNKSFLNTTNNIMRVSRFGRRRTFEPAVGTLLSAWPNFLLLASVTSIQQAQCAGENKPSKGKYVVIHIWQPPSGAALDGEPGHVSLSICENGQQLEYVSFWPSSGGKSADGSQGKFITLAQDIRNEGRKPDVDIVLYSLDVDAIKKHCELLKDSEEAMTWVAKKDLPTNTYLDDKQNCATAVWQTLIAGGITNNYKPKGEGPNDPGLRDIFNCDHGILNGTFNNAFWRKWASTPQFILHLSASVKEQELKKYPQTKEWDGGIDYSGVIANHNRSNKSNISASQKMQAAVAVKAKKF